jgi:hypothetical protein
MALSACGDALCVVCAFSSSDASEGNTGMPVLVIAGGCGAKKIA